MQTRHRSEFLLRASLSGKKGADRRRGVSGDGIKQKTITNPVTRRTRKAEREFYGVGVCLTPQREENETGRKKQKGKKN